MKYLSGLSMNPRNRPGASPKGPIRFRHTPPTQNGLIAFHQYPTHPFPGCGKLIRFPVKPDELIGHFLSRIPAFWRAPDPVKNRKYFPAALLLNQRNVI
jgi:hypothetical protein